MNWPQITIIALGAIGFGFAAAKHGEPQGNYSVFWTAVGMGVEFFILWQGGFFGGAA